MMYEVWAKHADKDEFVAIAEGDPADILVFFDKKAGYGLVLQEMRTVKVAAGTAKRAEEIKKRQKELKEEQAKLEYELAKNSCR